MGLKFLTDDWFSKVEELKSAAGELEVPAGIQDLVVNITVTDAEGDVDMTMNAGNFEKGHADNAPTKLTLPAELARQLFIENDQAAAMQGFMTGQIKVEGDMSKLMAMQTVKPSKAQMVLQKKIIEMTE